jgi:hypothetical protein
MHFATRVRTWRVARLYSVQYSEIALSRKQFGIGHMYIYNFLLRMTDTMTSQNIDLFSSDTLYKRKNMTAEVCNAHLTMKTTETIVTTTNPAFVTKVKVKLSL